MTHGKRFIVEKSTPSEDPLEGIWDGCPERHFPLKGFLCKGCIGFSMAFQRKLGLDNLLMIDWGQSKCQN